MNVVMMWMLLLGAAPPGAPDAGSDAGVVGTEAAIVGEALGASGRVRVEVRSAAVPLRRGMQAFQVRIRDAASGKPVAGVVLSVQPWMPSMGHGIQEVPRVTEREAGTFDVTDTDLFMPGAWELRFTLKGTAEDTAAVSLKLGR
jgi:hypothetical protein